MALNFPNPALQTPLNEFSPDSTPAKSTNGVTYIWTNNEKWVASSVVFNDIYVNVTGDNMTGDLTLGTDKITLNAADGNATFAGDIQSTSQNGGQLAGFRNQLINGDFRIAQRYPSYPGTSIPITTNPNSVSLYSVDRWGVSKDFGFQSRTERPSNFFVGSMQWRTQTSGPSAGKSLWAQTIEMVAVAGKGPRGNPLLDTDFWTVSHWIFTADRNDFQCFVQYVNSNYSPSISGPIATINDVDWTVVETDGDWTRVSATFSMASVAAAPADTLGIRVQFQNTGNIRAVGAQLEPGPVATPFEHRPIGTELALCQRYYETGSCGGQVFLGSVTRDGNDFFSFPIAFKANKRVSPSCTAVISSGSRTSPGINNISITSASGYSSGPTDASQGLDWTADAEL